MNIKYYAILLLTVFLIGFYPKESFAPIIPDSNSTTDSNGTITQSYVSDSPDLVIIVIGIVIGVSLIIFVLSRLNRQSGSTSERS